MPDVVQVVRPSPVVSAVQVTRGETVRVVRPDAVPPSVRVSRQGPPGVAGVAGASQGAYTHVQSSPSAVWTVQHGLGFNARPTVLDPSGDVVFGWVPTWPSINVLILTFPSALSGTAYLS